MRRARIVALAAIATLFVIACAPLPQSTKYAPFADNPNDVYTFRHKLVIVKGTVWIFEDDGEPVLYGGPVGTLEHSYTYVIEVTPKIFDLPDHSSVMQTNPSTVVELRDAADKFCEETGYTGLGSGTAILSTSNANLLPLHCLPPGVEIPRDGKAGDDVQRNPLYRGIGVPPLRGRDFYLRYPPRQH